MSNLYNSVEKISLVESAEFQAVNVMHACGMTWLI